MQPIKRLVEMRLGGLACARFPGTYVYVIKERKREVVVHIIVNGTCTKQPLVNRCLHSNIHRAPLVWTLVSRKPVD